MVLYTWFLMSFCQNEKCCVFRHSPNDIFGLYIKEKLEPHVLRALPLKMKTRPIFDFVIFLPLLPQMKNDTFQKAFDLDTYLPAALDAVSFFGFLSKPQSRGSETTFPKLSYTVFENANSL